MAFYTPPRESYILIEELCAIVSKARMREGRPCVAKFYGDIDELHLDRNSRLREAKRRLSGGTKYLHWTCLRDFEEDFCCKITEETTT